jgi:gluconokinase
MGVSASGKTTSGVSSPRGSCWEFLEADELHSASNIAKMSAGVPLGDADRAPWLAAVRAGIESCTAREAKWSSRAPALKEAYRGVLAPDPARREVRPPQGGPRLIRARMAGRSGHFMKESLLRSQFEALEEPSDALTLDAARSPDFLAQRVLDVLALP